VAAVLLDLSPLLILLLHPFVAAVVVSAINIINRRYLK